MEVVIVAIAVLFVIVMFIVATSNRLTRLKHLVQESWAQVDVALKRRYDLIPNLVETCKAFAGHERDVLERVVEARNRALHQHRSVSDHALDERALVASLSGLLVRAEGYPELASSRHFLELQRELANTEDRIAAARRFYNANVRDYNTALEQFPGSLMAGGHRPADFFEIDTLEVRKTPIVR